MTKKTYTVLAPLSHDNRDYAPNEPVELDDGQAAPLLDLKVVEAAPAAEAKSEQPREPKKK